MADRGSRYQLVKYDLLWRGHQYQRADVAFVSLATGGSAIKAIEVLLETGVAEERIIFLNLIASPEGLHNICDRFHKVKVISAWVDERLDEHKYIRERPNSHAAPSTANEGMTTAEPGLGDFGDRYFSS